MEAAAGNASDPAALAELARGADAIYNCANPGTYMEWQRAWPPLAASLLAAAEATGAVLVTTSNLYGYGPVDGSMTDETPLRPTDHKGELRVRMWQEALAAHDAGRVRTTEARGSDYIGPTLPTGSGILAMYASSTLAGKPAFVFGDPDAPHTWTAIRDVARTLAVLGADERAWGRAWLVPSAPAVSVRTALRELGRRAGAGEPRLRRLPGWLIRGGGLVVPLLREVGGLLYQFDRPFVVDSTATNAEFGIEPTDWELSLCWMRLPRRGLRAECTFERHERGGRVTQRSTVLRVWHQGSARRLRARLSRSCRTAREGARTRACPPHGGSAAWRSPVRGP